METHLQLGCPCMARRSKNDKIISTVTSSTDRTWMTLGLACCTKAAASASDSAEVAPKGMPRDRHARTAPQVNQFWAFAWHCGAQGT